MLFLSIKHENNELSHENDLYASIINWTIIIAVRDAIDGIV